MNTTLNAMRDTFSKQYNQPDTTNPAEWLTSRFNITPPIPQTPMNRTILGYMIGIDGRVERSLAATSLCAPIPFIARPVSNDLTISERKNYRLRRTLAVEGIMTAFYYMKMLPPILTPSCDQRTIIDGNVTSTPFIPPGPLMDWSIGTLTNTILYLGSSISIEFTTFDVTPMHEACALLGIQSPVVRELGLVSAMDVPITDEISEVYGAILHSQTHLNGEFEVNPIGSISLHNGFLLGGML